MSEKPISSGVDIDHDEKIAVKDVAHDEQVAVGARDAEAHRTGKAVALNLVENPLKVRSSSVVAERCVCMIYIYTRQTLNHPLAALHSATSL
jgi:hypothetical protein